MPIISAAKNLSFPQDSLFKRPTVFTWPQTPEYAFFFRPPEDSAEKAAFGKHFFFDDCTDFRKNAHDVTVTLPDQNQIDINDHSVHYLRLYALKYLGCDDPKYYLAPWLTVPYDLANGLYSPAARAQSAPGPAVISMQVVPYSIYEGNNSKVVTKKVKAASVGRTLTLTSSNTSVIQAATWNSNSLATIAEVDCVRPQAIRITIQASSNPYPYQAYLDVVDSDGFHVGRMYLLFLQNVPHNVIFFNAAKKTGSNTELTITMLDPATEPVLTYLADMNAFYSKVGITHTAVSTPVRLGSEAADVAYPRDIAGVAPSIDGNASHDTAADFSVTSAQPSNVLYTLYKNFVHLIDAAIVNQHLFVFIADWASGSITTVTAVGPDGQPTATNTSSTSGISYPGTRLACVYTYSSETLCHEVGHALGLMHYYFELNRAPARIVTDVQTSATRMGEFALPLITASSGLNIETQRDFYMLHDDMNLGDSCVIFQNRPTPQAGFQRVQDNFSTVNVDRFRVTETNNIMDYRDTDTSATVGTVKRDKIVKHQIELVRLFVGNCLVGITVPEPSDSVR